jgi:hypothetical protein
VRLIVIAAAAAALAVLFAACGEDTIIPEGAENSVAEVVSEDTDFNPTDVECPSDVPAEVGGEFECTFTGPDAPYIADVKITEVEGESVRFQVNTRPTE